MSALSAFKSLSSASKTAHGSRSCACPMCAPSASRAARRAVRPAPRTSTIMAASQQELAQDRISKLLVNNRKWASAQIKYDPSFFNRLRDQQSPEYLWIGCADSRVPANTIVGLDPGQVFVQRNVGNQASHTDMNVQACIEFSVKALKVNTIILCGHYKCGAVKAALTLPSKTPGLVNCWISDIREARNQHLDDLKGLTEDEQVARLCEFNVLRQVFHVCTSPTVQEAWDNGTDLNVYGMCYSLEDGLLQQLVGPINSNEVLGTTEPEVFVNRSMEKKPQPSGALAALRKLFPLLNFDSDAEEEQAGQQRELVTVNSSVSPTERNTSSLSRKLSEHVSWEKGVF